ncbi:hypothetical protein MA20_46735 [Bradyrhizobium japonicum]|uniref:Uncharacterized protein n=1 Tax=Bradyrhizobium japonicum TaxID=375 RepID=A0A0A3XFJ7_BRAJP|nr:hypothetical protein [Bradyrhizobium japonicum]KGT73050.1 hypothetical protein MA20_46735 [Bradyrhizobium japonicum]
MTPQQLLAELQKTTELLDWILKLVPPCGGGSNLLWAPPDLEAQFKVLGIADGTFIDRYSSFLKRTDWVHNAFEDLVSKSPALRQICRAYAGIASGTVNDAEFNGHVYSFRSSQGLGYVIALPMGAMPLISSGAEMLMLLADTSLCETLGNALTKKGLGKDSEPWLLRLRRRLVRFSSRPYLAKRFSKQIGWQFGMMIHRYVHLGTADTPDVIRELGAIPLVTDVRRWGHPLEAGSNLRFFAIQFLLLHECGHVAAGDLSTTDTSHFEMEFAADGFAFRELIGSADGDDVAISGTLGAWLILTLAAWIEDLSQETAPRSHPPARERLERLRAYLRSREQEQPSMTRALEVFDAMASMQKRLFEEAKSAGVLTMESPLSRFLSMCAQTGRHEMFYDQLPRWLLFGAPSRLCRELARLRVCMERRIESDQQDGRAKEQLGLINWVFDAALAAPSNFLSRKLQAFYARARAATDS